MFGASFGSRYGDRDETYRKLLATTSVITR